MLEIIKSINAVLWGPVLLVLLVGCGLFFTILLRCVQVRDFGKAMKQTFASFSLNGKKAGKDGMSSFQSLATAVAGQVGTGNLAGAATAIVSGGPGAIFWMWVSAFLGMATIFAEAVLAQTFKVRKKGHIVGGPAFYLRYGLGSKFLAGVFSVLIILALGLIGNMVQANSIGAAFHKAFHIPQWIVGVVIAGLAAVVFFGGIKRIASFTEKIVPVMAIFYIIGGVIILIKFGGHTLEAFRMIFVGAFNPDAVLGGAAGITVRAAIRYGVARGLFSNEAGMGSTPHAHAVAKVDHPVQQGMAAMVGVFFDTFVILTITALVIISSGANLQEGLKGIDVTQWAFESGFGTGGIYFIAVSLFFFAFSTIIGWYFFGAQNVRYLFEEKGVKIYTALVVVFVFFGTLMSVDLVWELADTFNGLMVIPNVIGLFGLMKIVKKKVKEYEAGCLVDEDCQPDHVIELDDDGNRIGGGTR